MEGGRKVGGREEEGREGGREGRRRDRGGREGGGMSWMHYTTPFPLIMVLNIKQGLYLGAWSPWYPTCRTGPYHGVPTQA